jgi:maltose O-acetyltransferase
MSLTYLWKNREKQKFLSKKWIKSLAKRIYNLPELIKIILRKNIYKLNGATIGNLTIIGKFSSTGNFKKLSIGSRTSLGTGMYFSLYDKITIGNRVVINDGVLLLTGSHDTADSSWKTFGKPIIIEDYAWIARKAIILPGVKIGKGAVVGAAAVVSRDVPDFAIVVGNPAKIVGQRNLELAYSPVDLCAPYEAWLGNPEKK